MKFQRIQVAITVGAIICALAAALVLVTPAGAAYLRDVPQTLVQPNKVVIHCLASGDEYFNWLHDAQGYVIIQDPGTGYYTYAVEANGNVVSSKYIVGVADPVAAGLTPNIKPSLAVLQAKMQARMAAVPSGPKASAAPTTGAINNIVIFIRFSGESEFGDPLSTYDSLFNNATAGANSLRNFYWEASYNQLSITSTFYPGPSGGMVVSWQDTAHTRGYFRPFNAVTNPGGYTSGAQSSDREWQLCHDAVVGVSSQIPAGLNVDGDGDGKVDSVDFIIDGAADGWNDLLWPHMWNLYSHGVQINGKDVWGYDLQLQNMIASNGVGVLCHEMFHTLGAPDLYHYSTCSSDTSISPAGPWDPMDNTTNPPQHMNAYMKSRYGHWISSIPTISTPGRYTLNPLTSPTGNCFRINSPNTSDEYFVVEYRRRMGTFENSLPDSGLLVWRIRPSLDGNACGPPDGVYVYRPGGTTTANGSTSNAAFSLDAGRTMINDSTNPSSFLTNGSAGGLQICGVGVHGDTISFNLGPAATVLTASPSAGKSSDPFSLKACLKDAYGNPLPGVTIHFDLEGIRYDAVTGPDGCAVTTNIYRCLTVAVYQFKATWDGDVCYAASTGQSTLTISCDPTAITDDVSKTHTVQYSDPITLGGWLKDEEGLELTGKILTFTVGTESCADYTGPGGADGCQPDNNLTGRNGYASCTFTIDQPASGPGCTPITSGIAFAGDTSYCASSKPITVTIQPENATIKTLWEGRIGCGSASGDGTTMKLSAYVTEETDGSYGDITKAGPICFDIFDYTGTLINTYCANLVAKPNPDPGGPPTVGYGEVNVPQRVGIYCITVRQQGKNCYYTAAPVEQTTVVNCQNVAPIIGGVPQYVDIDPDTAPVFDSVTSLPVIDPLTGLQATTRTWKNYMFFATPCQLNLPTILQTVSVQKIIPERKIACGAGWSTEPTTVAQRGIQDIQTRWPLLYEVDGTEIRLTVTYNTMDRRAYPPGFGPNVASRVHVETYSWFVKSNTWAAFMERLNFFAKLPAGTCETLAVTPVAKMKIDQFINGYGAGLNYQPGIMQLIAMGKPIPAAAKFSALESYMDSVCYTECSGLYAGGVSAGTPDPKAEAILDNPTTPADSLLINDLWAVGKTLGILIDKN